MEFGSESESTRFTSVKHSSYPRHPPQSQKHDKVKETDSIPFNEIFDHLEISESKSSYIPHPTNPKDHLLSNLKEFNRKASIGWGNTPTMFDSVSKDIYKPPKNFVKSDPFGRRETRTHSNVSLGQEQDIFKSTFKVRKSLL